MKWEPMKLLPPIYDAAIAQFLSSKRAKQLRASLRNECASVLLKYVTENKDNGKMLPSSVE